MDGYGTSALMVASSILNTKIIKILLEYGADINSKNCFRYTALMIVALKYTSNSLKRYETLKLLLENCADVNLKNIEFRKAYDLARTEDCKDLIKSYMN